MQMDSANVLYGFCAQNAFQTYLLCIFCRPYSHPVRTTTYGQWTATFTSSENGPCRITVKLLKTCSSYHVNSETFCFVEKKVCPNKWKWSLSESRLILPAAVFSVNVDNALEIRKSKVERREVLECFSSGKLGPRTHFSTTRHQGKL